MANAAAGSTIRFTGGIISETLTIDKSLTLEGHPSGVEDEKTVFEGGFKLAIDKPVTFTVKNAVIDGKGKTAWSVSS